MNIAPSPTAPTISGWFSQTEAWLDNKGKGAWIAAMVLGFIFFWPVGFAFLAYMIWSKRMFSGNCGSRRSSHRRSHGFSSSGNTAFDAYKADTIQRLKDEQDAFEAFLARLRDAKDKTEFDQFLDDRARNADAPAQSAPAVDNTGGAAPQQN